ncbi:2-(1,2-epoxy-1,2-dihydrophenyl)acetyl-CoA isomerase [Nonlabens dokdonensis]|uniref:2-(1,2-epoxy-1,2-dihydrophenyl)acetyl-CoA isomerase n=1 Tax=Nonlabens dokdonensis TaxID=328515 RepID=A0A1Z8AM63_9FLAO|nr:enoyl-CoA hydratase-related protein [Nonlabens dokdonensis]OUS11435.1 2-(1,2-epoxy-1,2-dihydrophenyl)acetyl-CoA isomerase [Nonlabens dokdonensis]
MSNSILMHVENGVATITLNRPQVFNSFNREMAFAMQDALDQCVSNDEVRAVMIIGDGKAFCAGQDIQEITDPELNPGFKAILDDHYNPIVLKIRNLEKPVVAAVNGVAAGAGANIALCCDVVIATESAAFIQAFSKIGLIPDSAGTFFLPRLIGFGKASAAMMLADKITAQEADQMGMIYKVVKDEDFLDFTKATSQKLAALPTVALANTKKALNQSYNNTVEEQLALESKLQIESASTEDYAEGVASFMEKRKPVFKGK